MAKLLQKWLNSYELSSEVRSISRDLSNGYLIAELLHKEGRLSGDELIQYENGSSKREKVENFGLLETVFKRLGMQVTSKLISEVINERAGAAVRLVFFIKCALEPEAAPSIKTFVLTPEETNYAEPIERVLEKPAPSRIMQRAMEKRLTTQQTKMALHLQEFDKVRMEAEEKALREREEAFRIETEKRKARREETWSKLREKRKAAEAVIQDGRKNWEKNQNVKIAREREELKFELTFREQRDVKKHNDLVIHSEDAKFGIDTFDRNLKRLGISTNEDQANEKDQSETSIVVASHRKSRPQLEEKLASFINGEKGNARSFMRRLKQDRLIAIKARKEREQRRRKLFVDQELSRQSVEALRANSELLEKYDRESRLERAQADQARRRRFRATQRQSLKHAIASQRIRKRQLELTRQLRENQTRIRSEHEQLQNSAQYRELIETQMKTKAEKTKALREKSVKACAHVLDLLVGLAMEASYVRPMNPSKWISLKSRFVQGDALLSSWGLFREEQEQIGKLDPIVQEAMEDEKVAAEVYAEVENFQALTGRWEIDKTNRFGAPGEIDLGSLHMRHARHTIETLQVLVDAASREGPIQAPKVNHLPCIGFYIVGPPKCGKSSLATRMKYRLGVEVIDPVSIAREAKRFLETPCEDGRPETEPVSAAYEAMQRLGEVAAKGESDSLLSLEMAIIVADRVATLVDNGRPWALDGFPRTKDQARMLDYCKLSPEEREREIFTAYCTRCDKTQAQNGNEKREAIFLVKPNILAFCSDAPKSAQAAAFQEWWSKHEFLSIWSESWETICIGDTVKPSEQDDDGDETQRFHLSEDSLADARDQFLRESIPSVCTAVGVPLPVDLNHGIALLRDHLEALDEHGSGQPVKLDKARTLLEKFKLVHMRYNAKVLGCVFHIIDVQRGMLNQSKDLENAGYELIRGAMPPQGVSSPLKTKEALLESWDSNVMHRLFPGMFNPNLMVAMRKRDLVNAKMDQVLRDKEQVAFESLVELEERLWDEFHRYTKIATDVLAQWRCEKVDESWVEELSKHGVALVEAELDRFLKTRELVKEYFTAIECPRPVAETSARALNEAICSENDQGFRIETAVQEQLLECFTRAQASIKQRKARGENASNPSHDSLSLQLSKLNCEFELRLSAMRKIMVEMMREIKDRYERLYDRLEDGISSRVREVNSEIVTLVNERENGIRKGLQLYRQYYYY